MHAREDPGDSRRYEHAKSMRTVLVIYPGRRGGFDLFDSATRLGHYRTKKKAKAAAERRHTSLQMLGITRG